MKIICCMIDAKNQRDCASCFPFLLNISKREFVNQDPKLQAVSQYLPWNNMTERLNANYANLISNLSPLGYEKTLANRGNGGYLFPNERNGPTYGCLIIQRDRCGN